MPLPSVPVPNLKAPAVGCAPAAGCCSASPPNSFLLTGVCTLSDLLILVDTGVEDVTAAPVMRMRQSMRYTTILLIEDLEI